MFIAYVACVTYYWKWENSFFFGLVGQTFWLGIIFYACSFLGPLQIPALFISLGYITIASVYYYKYVEVDEATGAPASDDIGILEKCANYWRPQSNEDPSQTNDLTSNGTQNESTASDTDTPDSPRIECGSDVYFKALFIACLVTIFYKQLLMIFLAFIPIGIYLCNRLIHQFGIKEFAAGKIDEITAFIQVNKFSLK